MPSRAARFLNRRNWRVWLLVAASAALMLALLAPGVIGRFVGGLWVGVMSAVIELIEALVGG